MNGKEEYDKFVDYVLSDWKKKGLVKDEKETRDFIDMIMYLLYNYRLKCLIRTIIDIDDLMEKYEKGIENE